MKQNIKEQVDLPKLYKLNFSLSQNLVFISYSKARADAEHLYNYLDDYEIFCCLKINLNLHMHGICLVTTFRDKRESVSSLRVLQSKVCAIVVAYIFVFTFTGRETELTNKPPDQRSLHREPTDQDLLEEALILSHPPRLLRKNTDDYSVNSANRFSGNVYIVLRITLYEMKYLDFERRGLWGRCNAKNSTHTVFCLQLSASEKFVCTFSRKL